jgi:O-antigen ligase
MLGRTVESNLARFLLIGLPIATVFVLMNVNDPLNAPKLLTLGALAGGVVALTVVFGNQQSWIDSKWLLISGLVFLLAMLNAVLQSSSPLVQNFYGSYARNTGFVTYLFLLLIAFGSALLREKRSFVYLSVALLFAGGVNIIYGAWTVFFGDFLPWANTTNAVIGFFGNTNFMGAFLGMFLAGTAAWSFSAVLKPWQRILILFLGGMAIYLIFKTYAVQGKVVSILGLFIVGFYFLRSKTQSSIPAFIYSLVGAAVGFIGLLGILQIGPLKEYIYKSSISFRGVYWRAGIEMGNAHPFSGVGMDSYGDNYRLFRSINAAVITSNSTADAAHNVFIDFFASGGWPLLFSYLLILFIALIAIVKVTLRSRTYDPSFVAIVSVWMCYQSQSIVSINQIGLAVWGWVLTGALIGYERASRNWKQDSREFDENGRNVNSTSRKKEKSKAKDIEQGFTPGLVGAIGITIGTIVSLPPYTSDLNWRSSINNLNLQTIEQDLGATYFTPTNSFQLVRSGMLFEANKLYDLSYRFAKRAVEFNPNNFASWQLLLSVTNATLEDKIQATANMKRLDPLNPQLNNVNP